MQLRALLSELEALEVEGDLDREITSIAYDSRRVEKGALFVALPGTRMDGSHFIGQAVERGAAAIVSAEPEEKTRAARILVKNARVALAELAATFYGRPAQHLKMAAITGTNGKTTTSFLLKHIAERELLRCGLIGTVRYEIGERLLPASRTTPESLDVHHLLHQIRSAGCKAAVIEVSSHALVQERVRGIEWDTAIFTNLTQDHLDYHQTMEAYFEAKERLFAGLARQTTRKGKAVINIDDPWGGRLIDKYGREVPIITYGVGSRAEFRASNFKSDFTGTSYQLDALGKSFLVRIPLIGRFNISNSLAAIAGAHALGLNLRDAVLSLAGAPAVPGRLEAVPAKRQFKVFVDYAHTDDALVNVMKTLRELSPKRLIVVFGCGGDRDRAKRPLMGAAVNSHADHAIITSDNPRREDPQAIIEEVKNGFRSQNFEVIVDRKEAIFKAISMAQSRDIILIAGKGHEAYQEFADHTLPFDDVAVAGAAIEGHPVEMGY